MGWVVLTLEEDREGRRDALTLSHGDSAARGRSGLRGFSQSGRRPGGPGPFGDVEGSDVGTCRRIRAPPRRPEVNGWIEVLDERAADIGPPIVTGRRVPDQRGARTQTGKATDGNFATRNSLGRESPIQGDSRAEGGPVKQHREIGRPSIIRVRHAAEVEHLRGHCRTRA